jgi:hypothetical protein
MGTNYYWHPKPPCAACGREFDPKHIGKSPAGWTFALHVDDEVKSLDDWRELWAIDGSIIKDEYGDTVSIEDMLKVILDRSWGRDEKITPMGYSSWDEFHRINDSYRGLNGLLRRRRAVVPDPDAMYELVTGEFS